MTPNLKLLKPEPVAPPYLFELQYCKPDRAAYKTTRQAGENPVRSIPILDL